MSWENSADIFATSSHNLICRLVRMSSQRWHCSVMRKHALYIYEVVKKWQLSICSCITGLFSSYFFFLKFWIYPSSVKNKHAVTSRILAIMFTFNLRSLLLLNNLLNFINNRFDLCHQVLVYFLAC